METSIKHIVRYSMDVDLSGNEEKAQELIKMALASLLFQFARSVEREEDFMFPKRVVLSIDYETIGWDSHFIIKLEKEEGDNL